jgi:hypothetical protein
MRKLMLIVSVFFAIQVTTPIVVHVEAQTLLYSDRSVTAPVSPTVNAAWTVTSGNTYTMLLNSKSAYCVITSAANFVSGASTTTAPQKMLAATFISQPLIAQTINSGSTVSAQFRALKNASAGTGQLTFYVRYCNEDGTNVQEIGNFANTTSALSTTLTNKTLTLTLGSNITISDGQRIIVEIGETFTTGTTNHTCSVGSNINSLTADLPVDNTTITASTPWIQFSQTLSFRNRGITL